MDRSFSNSDGSVSFPYHDPLQPCQYVSWTLPNPNESTFGRALPIKTKVSCTQICNDSISLFGSQQIIWSIVAYGQRWSLHIQLLIRTEGSKLPTEAF